MQPLQESQREQLAQEQAERGEHCPVDSPGSLSRRCWAERLGEGPGEPLVLGSLLGLSRGLHGFQHLDSFPQVP